MQHIPVLKEQIVKLFLPISGIMVDATIGSAGHSIALLNSKFKNQNAKSNLKFKIIGIDQDYDALTVANSNLKTHFRPELESREISKLGMDYDKTVTLIHGNFRNIKQILKELKVEKVSGILADLGMSSMQLEDPQRGFSFKHVAPLDMRMAHANKELKIVNEEKKIQIIHNSKFIIHNSDITAWQIIHAWNESKLADVLWQYGEERFARKIAKAIAHNRKDINTTQDLASLVEKVIPPRYRKHGIHPTTKTFQALRIAVNDEIEALKDFLADAPELLEKGGRLAIISFHSLEDRLVKQNFHALSADGDYKLLTKHPIIATEDEIAQNPRSRSAKLRCIERL